MPHFLIFALIFAFQYFLSTRASVYCGWIFTTHQVNHPIKVVLLMLLGLAMFLLEWEKGRESFKKKQQNELNKMKTQDI